jgi:hypothetical protein
VDAAPRMESLSNRRLLLSLFHNSTASMRHSLSGERTFPMFLLLSSRHRIDLHTRSSSNDRPEETSNLRFWSHVVLNSSVLAHRSASLPPLRTLSLGQRWPTSSLRKRIPLDVSYGSSQYGQKFLTHQFTFLDPPIFFALKLILPTTSLKPAFLTHQCLPALSRTTKPW